jgi:uncharacterized membrane protein
MKRTKLTHSIFILLLIFSALLVLRKPCLSYEKRDNGSEPKPERLITMAAEYPGIVLPKNEDVNMDIIFYNKGRQDENVNVWIDQQPDDWETRIKTYRYTVTGVHVPSDQNKTLTFEAEPVDGVKPGEYQFLVKAQTPDGEFKLSEKILVVVKEAEAEPEKNKGVKLTTSYPVISGPSDATFEFSVEVDSELDEDAVFDLFAKGPQGWDINFKPAYESKYISSLRLKANESKSIAIEVKPSIGAKAGEYPVNIRVSSSQANGKAELKVILSGTYDLEVGTPNGLLSLDAGRGSPSNVSFYIKNTGSAANHGIQFMSFKPENWKVEFDPERVDAIEPGDLKQVEMKIIPYEDALVGDYSVSVNVQGEKATKNLELRTTVKASAAWGWIGIGIIVVVIGGLFGVFRWLGRR